MVVDAALQGFKQGRLAVITTPDDQGDAGRDQHSGDPAGVRHSQAAAQLRRGAERHTDLQRAIIDPAAARQQRTVRDKGHAVMGFQLFAQSLLIRAAFDMRVHTGQIAVDPDQGIVHHAGQLLEEHGGGFAGENRASRSGQGEQQAGIEPAIVDQQRVAFENLLAADRDLHTAAAAGPAVAPDPPVNRRGHRPAEKILQGGLADRGVPEAGWQAVLSGGQLDADLRGQGKGIALHMIDAQGKVAEVVTAPQLFIGLIAAPLQRVQLSAQPFHVKRPGGERDSAGRAGPQPDRWIPPAVRQRSAAGRPGSARAAASRSSRIAGRRIPAG